VPEEAGTMELLLTASEAVGSALAAAQASILMIDLYACVKGRV
jgi:hypothetical protein